MNHAYGAACSQGTPPCRESSNQASSSELSREEINQLPIQAWDGDVVIVQDKQGLDAALEALRHEKIIGFDTETKPTFSKGNTALPALVQLAAVDCVYLIQLTHVPFDAALAELLSSPDNLKVGVAIHDDMKALNRHYPFTAGGVVDLAAIARSQGLRAQGLRTLAANLLGFRISKSAQCSNWENPSLSPQQIKYAATDAWVGRQIYLHLERRRVMKQAQRRPAAED